LDRFWLKSPQGLQPPHVVGLHHDPNRLIVVLPGRLVQLGDGTLLSLVAWCYSGTWQYGVANLARAAREGWNECSVNFRLKVALPHLIGR
jgi:hypothetical protein